MNLVNMHTPSRYNIVFSDFTEKRRYGLCLIIHCVLNIFLKKNFRHVLAISVDGLSPIIVEPDMGRLRVSVATRAFCESVLSAPNIIVLKGVAVDQGNSFFLGMNISCVSTIKYLLGVRAVWVNTPYQLYKYLKKKGL